VSARIRNVVAAINPARVQQARNEKEESTTAFAVDILAESPIALTFQSMSARTI
jgi:hypothetical protein